MTIPRSLRVGLPSSERESLRPLMIIILVFVFLALFAIETLHSPSTEISDMSAFSVVFESTIVSSGTSLSLFFHFYLVMCGGSVNVPQIFRLKSFRCFLIVFFLKVSNSASPVGSTHVAGSFMSRVCCFDCYDHVGLHIVVCCVTHWCFPV